MGYTLLLVIFAFGSYLVGNVNFALIISKLKHRDIRKMGSGNPGALNMSRNLGIKTGILTLFLDACKGALPTLVAYLYFYNGYFTGTAFRISDFAMYLCGLCVIVGHIYPVFLGFRGGKGIASTIGALIVCTAVHGWWVFLSLGSFAAAIAYIYYTEFGGMGSFIAITPSLIFNALYLFSKYGLANAETPYLIAADVCIFLFFFFTWFAHRKNISDMLNGTEHPTSIKSMAAKERSKKAARKGNGATNEP